MLYRIAQCNLWNQRRTVKVPKKDSDSSFGVIDACNVCLQVNKPKQQ